MVWSLWFCGADALCAGAPGTLARPRCKVCSFPSDPRSRWGTVIESRYLGIKNKKGVCGLFLGKTSQTKNFLEEP